MDLPIKSNDPRITITRTDDRILIGLGAIYSEDLMDHDVLVKKGDVLTVAQGGTGAKLAKEARENLGLGSLAVQNRDAVDISGGKVHGVEPMKLNEGGTAAKSAEDARKMLGLGSLCEQNANSVSITGGSIDGIKPLSPECGGTGADSLEKLLDMVSPASKKGEMLVHNGKTHETLPAGPKNHVLVSDPDAPLGVRWAPQVREVIICVTAPSVPVISEEKQAIFDVPASLVGAMIVGISAKIAENVAKNPVKVTVENALTGAKVGDLTVTDHGKVDVLYPVEAPQTLQIDVSEVVPDSSACGLTVNLTFVL